MKRHRERSKKHQRNVSSNVSETAQIRLETDKSKRRVDKSKSLHTRTHKGTSIPDWYLDKMRKAFQVAGERLLGNPDITEAVFKRQVNLCCQDMNLQFRSDAFTKIYHEEKEPV